MTFNIAQLICLIGALQALQLCLVTLVLRAENRRANGLFAMAIFMIGLLLFLAAGRFGEASLAGYRYELVHAWGMLAMMVSPLIYLYVRTSVGSFQFRGITLLHFLPSLIHLCLLFPLWVLDAEARGAMIEKYIELELYRSFVPGIRIGAIQATAYWLGCFFWVRRLQRHIRETASFSDRLHLRWLKWLTSLLVLLLAMLALGRLVAFADVELIGVLGFSLFLFAVNTTAMAKPELFQGIPQVLQMPPLQPESTDSRQDKYGYSNLEPDRKEFILKKLLAYFQKQKPFLNDDLTLADVCAALSISRGHVSQVINQTQQKSFHDFVNDFRIQLAQAMLEDQDQDHLSVDGVGVEVGFRSRSVFYAAFKKRIGKTPAAWRKQREPH